MTNGKNNKSSHQNGKGSKPRNLSNQFKKNYETINWRKKDKNDRKRTN